MRVLTFKNDILFCITRQTIRRDAELDPRNAGATRQPMLPHDLTNRGFTPISCRLLGLRLKMRDHFDLHVRAFRQRGDLDGGTSREIVGEIFRVNFVHAGKIAEIRQEYRAFHDVGER